MSSERSINCIKCMMPFEARFINKDGECVLCLEHRKKWLNRNYLELEKELIRILEFYKKRNINKKYDSIVAFTGGKDSSYALYLLVKKYGMRPLAVTADNGLLTKTAINNMEKVTKSLEVDHLIVSQDQEELRSLYRAFFKKTKNFCEICYLTIHLSLGQAAIDNDIPLLITGFAFKVDSSHFRASNRYCCEDAVANVVKSTLPAEVYNKYITKGIREKSAFHLIHLFDYVNHNESEIYDVLEKELGWDSQRREDKHSDCRFHHMLGYLRLQHNDLTSLALMTPAALFRDGQIKEEKFHELIRKQDAVFREVDQKQVEAFLDYFGIDRAFLDSDFVRPKYCEPLITEKDFNLLLEAKQQPGVGIRKRAEMLFEIIRPEFLRDGGDIRLLDIEDNVIKIEFLGACRACMIADMVEVRYIEHLVRKYISEEIVIENVKRLV